MIRFVTQQKQRLLDAIGKMPTKEVRTRNETLAELSRGEMS